MIVSSGITFWLHAHPQWSMRHSTTYLGNATDVGCQTSSPAPLNLISCIQQKTLPLFWSTSSSRISNPGPSITCSSCITQTAVTKPKRSIANLKILNVNGQSVKNRKEEIGNLIDSADPIVITGLRPDSTVEYTASRIHSSEIFPANYDFMRRDREDGYRGVLLAIRKDYIFEKFEIPVN